MTASLVEFYMERLNEHISVDWKKSEHAKLPSLGEEANRRRNKRMNDENDVE